MSYQYGDDLIGLIKAETNYSVPNKPSGTDAFRARAIALADAERERQDPGDRRGTFSVLERVEGKHAASWRTTVLHRPSGSLGSPPDIGPLWKMALGTETINAGSSVVYSQLKDRSALSYTIWGKLTDIVEFVRGAVCQQVTIRWDGRDYVVFEFSGIAKEYGETSETAANGAGTSTTSLVVDDLDFLSQYSIVQIGTDDNGGTGYLINAVDHTTETATLDTAASWADNASVTPFTPTGSFTGDPIYGTKGQVSFDGGTSTINTISGEVTIDTGMDLMNREFGYDSPTGVIMSGKWSIKGNIVLAVKKSETYLLSHARRQIQKDFQIILGNTAAKRVKIDMNQVEMDSTEKNIPDSGIVEVTIPFEALGSSGEDNLTLTYD